MAKARTARSRRQRGSIDELPSGALRVRVYAGVDPVTKRRHDLVEIIPPDPQAEKEAYAARDRLVNQVEERRNSRTNATVAPRWMGAGAARLLPSTRVSSRSA
jgi:integrase